VSLIAKDHRLRPSDVFWTQASNRQPACKSTPTGLQINANRPMGVQKVDI